MMSVSLSSVLGSGLCLALTVGGLVSLSPPAYAQGSTVEGITVTAPRRVGRSSTTGAPIEEVSAQRVVSYNDLDLRSASGAAELDKRISTAANEACRELETRYPVGTPDAFTCAKQARAAAQSQVDAAKAFAMQAPMPPAAAAAPAYAPPAAAVEPAAPPPSPAPAPMAGERG